MKRETLWRLPAIALFALCLLDSGPTRSEEEALSPPFELLRAEALSSGISIQGRLLDNGTPATGAFDFELRLFNAALLGSQVGVTVTLGDHPVVDGLFTFEADFGDLLFGVDPRWLSVGVRPGASIAAYEILTPRTKLSSTPQSLSLPNVYTDPSLPFVGVGRDFRITSNEVFGVRRTTGPSQYGGMFVETSDSLGWPFYGYSTNGQVGAYEYYRGDSSSWNLYNSGLRLTVPGTGGLRIGSAASGTLDALLIQNTAATDGIQILETGDDGLQVGSSPDYPNYGLYIPSPGVANYGLWPNTEQASGEWALYTADNIEAGNVAASAFSMVARLTGPDEVQAGDIVAVVSVSDPVPGSVPRLPQVRRADAQTWSGLVGVVEKRMAFKVAPGKEAEGEMSMQSEPGPMVAGDYVMLTIYGVADVNIDPSSSIRAGARLTASDTPGQARTLVSRVVEGMTISESAPTIGIALETPARGATRVPVFVTLK